MTSPCLRPALAAGEPSRTDVTSAPSVWESRKLLARSAVSGWMPTPNQPRVTWPAEASWLTTGLARLTGIANPMPTEPPLRLTIAVLMPTAWPRALISGPPLLPGLMEASVWMKSSYVPGGGDDDPGAEPALHARRHAAEELLEERIERLGRRLRRALHADVDDGRLERLRQRHPVGRGDRGRRDRDRLVAPERRRGRAAVSEGRAERDQDEDEAGGQRQPATESGIERHGIRRLFTRPV